MRHRSDRRWLTAAVMEADSCWLIVADLLTPNVLGQRYWYDVEEPPVGGKYQRQGMTVLHAHRGLATLASALFKNCAHISSP